jgi:hypothetical protein
MARLSHPFSAIGILSDFADPRSPADGNATFSLQVGNLSIPCGMRSAAGTPPQNGQRMHVIGAWVITEDRSLSVEVHAMYPATELRAGARRVVARVTPLSASAP